MTSSTGGHGWLMETETTVGAAHRPLREAVLAALRDAIVAGQYEQGERLVEEEIAARFEVSRNPIRDALHVLAVEGLVELEPRRGARVAVIEGRRARDLFEVRAPLEGLVARLSDVIRWAYSSHIQRRWEHSWREHATIVDAVAAGDPERAYREGVAHIANAAAVYLHA